MPNDDQPSPYLTQMEVAAYVRLTPRTLDNMRQRGTGPLYSKHGHRVLYHRDDVLAWVAATRRKTTTEFVPRPMSTSPDEGADFAL